jgi:hypothetical protein
MLAKRRRGSAAPPAPRPAPIQPVDAVLAFARGLLPVREAGANRGRFVEAIINYGGGIPGQPWCAYFIYYIGRRMLGASWPLPKTGSCDVLLEWARTRGMLQNTPARGALFLVMKSPTDATHVGFVDDLMPDRSDTAFLTVEGNSNDKGIRDGDGVVANVRGETGITAYRFIHWMG